VELAVVAKGDFGQVERLDHGAILTVPQGFPFGASSLFEVIIS
jgi:hypothetical protein